MPRKLRARDLGVPFDGVPGPLNAITDIPGVEVGHTTLVKGDGALVVGQGPVRTGVTVIHPLGRNGRAAVAAGRAVINGTGEWTGMHLVDELGEFFGPIALTGTGNVGLVHQALVDWAAQPGFLSPDELVMRVLPVVGETLDYQLNDVFGHPMSSGDVFAALDRATTGPVDEGNVGGGTGMIAYQFKGGIGTSSRVVEMPDRSCRVGVLLQANHGRRAELRIAGVPVGAEIPDLLPELAVSSVFDGRAAAGGADTRKSSLLIVIATDAPLQAHQLARLARRGSLGVGRCGSTAGNLSGEFVLAFSTTNTHRLDGQDRPMAFVSDNDSEAMNALFGATVQAVEEALVNQLVASETMSGADDSLVHGLPHDRLIVALRRHHRLVVPDRQADG